MNRPLNKCEVALLTGCISVLVTVLLMGAIGTVLTLHFIDQSTMCSTLQEDNNTSQQQEELLGGEGNLTSRFPYEIFTSCQLNKYSCKEIKEADPSSKSGYYQLAINSSDGTCYRYVYCSMDDLCGVGGGGWTRIAYLNLIDEYDYLEEPNCPWGFERYRDFEFDGCRRPYSDTGSCSAVEFNTYGIYYTEVCGTVRGRQLGTPDADDTSDRNNIFGTYIDGISILNSRFNDAHLWSYMADNGDHHCPCSAYKNKPPVGFIGDHYYCESGNVGRPQKGRIYPDRLWDGKGCDDSEKKCCTPSGIMPWFYRGNLKPGDNNIYFKLCCDQGTEDEDVLFDYYEFYIR